MIHVETTADLRLKQAHRFNATPRHDFVKLASKYRSICIGCNGPIEPGTKIMWARNCGSCCLPCFRDLKGGSK